jgi:hypothetical protein
LYCYYQQSKKPNARDFPEYLKLKEISELINGSDSEFDFPGDEDDDEADDILEPQIASDDIIVPKNTRKSQPISHRPSNPEGCTQIWIWWRCCSSLVKTNHKPKSQTLF